MARSFLLALALFTTLADAMDAMYDADGTLAHRVAVETDISDACASALLKVENEFTSRTLMQELDKACHEEVEDAIIAGDYVEVSPDGKIAMYINGVTLIVGVHAAGISVEPLVIDAVPGRYTGTGE